MFRLSIIFLRLLLNMQAARCLGPYALQGLREQAVAI